MATLEQLRDEAPFSSWEGQVNPKVLEESRRIYKATLTKLVLIGDGAAEACIPVLNEFIEEFNRLDEQYEFIETIEREDICEELGKVLDILEIPGVEECDDLPVERNW